MEEFIKWLEIKIKEFKYQDLRPEWWKNTKEFFEGN